MILLIDTTLQKRGNEVLREIRKADSNEHYELIDAAEMNISHCIGCNYCWLKTPGICTIKDDCEKILVKMIKAEQIWIISDTKYGFVSYKAKNIIDRMMPLVTMYLTFKDKQMRHIMRYDHMANIGFIYYGEADNEYLNRWSERTALNFGSNSLGVYSESQIKEAVSCML